MTCGLVSLGTDWSPRRVARLLKSNKLEHVDGSQNKRMNQSPGGSPRKTLVVLCGLPAAGKSTLAKTLVDHLNSTSSALSLSSSAAAITESGNNNTSLMLHALQVEFDLFEEQQLDGEDDDDNNNVGWSPSVWHAARSEAVKAVRRALEDPVCDFVVADDNCFYDSMRKELVHVASLCNARAMIVWMRISTEEAISRNAQRNNPVAVSVIRRMAERFDIPKNCLIVDSTESPDEAASKVHMHVQNMDPASEKSRVKTSPPLPPSEPGLRPTGQNPKQIQDLEFRKSVHLHLKMAMEQGKSPQELSELAKQLQAERKTKLQHAQREKLS